MTHPKDGIFNSKLASLIELNTLYESRDPYGHGHSLRVTLVSILIAQDLGLKGYALDTLRYAATLHDIGKIRTPKYFIDTQETLTSSSVHSIMRHTIDGENIVNRISGNSDIASIIRSHHERVDGQGYPDKLSTDQIPLAAKIISVADSWDALTSDRSYRTKEPSFIALEEIKRCSGKQFDPRVVDTFIEVLAKDPWLFGMNKIDLIAKRTSLPTPQKKPFMQRAS